MISYIKRYFQWLCKRSEIDISSLIIFCLSILIIQLNTFDYIISVFSQWYLKLIFFIAALLIFVTVLALIDGVLKRYLGKLNNPVRIRYYLLVALVLSFVVSFW